MLKSVAALDPSCIANVRLGGFLTNLRVESFAIHLRNLINFLYSDPSGVRDTDVHAGNFYSEKGLWEKVRPAISQTLEIARKRANKEVGHLTTERISGSNDPRKPWNIGDLTEEILSVLKLFSSSADKDKLGARVIDLLNRQKI